MEGYTRTFQKLGLRWYYNPGSQYATTSDYAAGGRPIVYMDAGMTWEDFVERVFEQAHVRRF